MMTVLILVLALALAVIFAQGGIIYYYRREANRDRLAIRCFEATIRSLNTSVAYYKDQNNRLRSLLNLSTDVKVEPSSKVIVLDRRRRIVKNPLTPRSL
jgi:hypothetical protein